MTHLLPDAARLMAEANALINRRPLPELSEAEFTMLGAILHRLCEVSGLPPPSAYVKEQGRRARLKAAN